MDQKIFVKTQLFAIHQGAKVLNQKIDTCYHQLASDTLRLEMKHCRMKVCLGQVKH